MHTDVHQVESMINMNSSGQYVFQMNTFLVACEDYEVNSLHLFAYMLA